MNFVNAINAVKSNILAFLLILLGAGMVIKGHDAIGGSLVTGAFAILRSSAEQHSNGTTEAK